MSTDHQIRIFVDSDERLTIERCAELSRHLEGILEENEWVPEKYLLEVSSPGVGEPLELLRQYKKNLGRKVEVKMNNGERYSGNLSEVSDDSIKVTAKQGKKKKEIEPKEWLIAFSEIKETKVKISF